MLGLHRDKTLVGKRMSRLSQLEGNEVANSNAVWIGPPKLGPCLREDGLRVSLETISHKEDETAPAGVLDPLVARGILDKPGD